MTMDSSSTDLPNEVIEEILSRSPVKSVVRFKSVSRSWQSIISDPRFSRTHRIQRSKLPENHNKFIILAQGMALGTHIHLIRMEEDGMFRTKSMLPYPSQIFDIPLCSCNGLILLGQNGKNRHFLLWNPSIRKHIMISGPHNGPLSPWARHFYYDSTSDDHKIVFVYEKCYAVYSCKNGNWSEMKDFPCDLKFSTVDGCFYGIDVVSGEIVCFDTRDGNLHKFRHPSDVKNAGLTEVFGRVYFYGLSKDGKGLQMWTMEKNGSFEKWCGVWNWRKLINMEKVEVGDLLCLTNDVCSVVKTKEVTDSPRKIEDKCYFDRNSPIFPYLENLYMPCSNILAP